MFRNVHRVSTFLAAGSIAFGMISAARASPYEGEQVQRPVTYSDLNLNRERDALTLYRRIDRAAHYVCVGGVGITPELRPAVQACLKKSIAEAVASVGHPNLTAVHEARLVGRRVVASR